MQDQQVPDYLNEYTLYDSDENGVYPYFTVILSDVFIDNHKLNRETLSEIISAPPDWLSLLKPVCLDCLASLTAGPLKRGCPPASPQT